MPAAKKQSRRRDTPAGPQLPPLTVSRFEQASMLVERLVAEKTDVFLGAMATYSDQHAAAVSRRLDHKEAASIAAGMAKQLGRDDIAALATEVQQSGLRAYDAPNRYELLAAAGVRTAPAFIDASLRLCALIEMDADAFERAMEHVTLDERIDDGANLLRKLDMPTARERAAHALEHFAQQSAGASPGEAWGLLTGVVWKSMQQAVTQLASRLPSSDTSQLTGSLEPTAGPAGTSSTA